MTRLLRYPFVAFLCLASQFTEAAEHLASLRTYTLAEIYYSHWWMTEQGERPALADELRSTRTEYGTKTSIRNPFEISALMDFLHVEAMSGQKRRAPGRPLLVIDISYTDGRVVSFFSDGSYLWDADGRRARRIGCEFRSTFTFVRQFGERCRSK
jgi:hypothetical protein